MTATLECITGGTVGRKRKNLTDKMPGRFPEGTFDRIAAVSRPKETRSDFVIEAVEAELERRERQKPKAGQ